MTSEGRCEVRDKHVLTTGMPTRAMRDASTHLSVTPVVSREMSRQVPQPMSRMDALM